MLFIISEALFFLAIFWAYFHSALTPTVELGSQWPPMGIECAPSEGVSVLKCSPTSHLYLVLDKCHEYSRITVPITISWWTAEYISDVWFGLPRKDNSVSGNWHAEDNKLDTHNHLQPAGNILSRIYRCYSSIAYHDGSSMMRSQKAGWSPHIGRPKRNEQAAKSKWTLNVTNCQPRDLTASGLPMRGRRLHSRHNNMKTKGDSLNSLILKAIDNSLEYPG